MMSFLRRLGIIAARKPSVMDAAGPLQHGVGCQDGTNKMIKSMQYFAEADPSRVLVALDLKAAFQNVSRRHMSHSLGQHDLVLATYTGTTTHRMHHDGSYTNAVLRQRLPLISRYILSGTKSKLDDGAKLQAYLDDWYI